MDFYESFSTEREGMVLNDETNRGTWFIDTSFGAFSSIFCDNHLEENTIKNTNSIGLTAPAIREAVWSNS